MTCVEEANMEVSAEKDMTGDRHQVDCSVKQTSLEPRTNGGCSNASPTWRVGEGSRERGPGRGFWKNLFSLESQPP